MPTAKKSTTARRKDSTPTSSSKPIESKKSRVTAKSTPSHANRITTGKPLPNPYPASTKSTPQPLPMPVEPGRLPSKTFEPLLRTTYNMDWIKRAGIILGIVAIAGVTYTGWTYRGYFQSLINSKNGHKPEPVTQLSISPTPAPDLDRLNQLSHSLSPQASASANQPLPVNQASSSAELSQFLQIQSSAELSHSLNSYISQLSQKKVNVNNLEAYREKADLLIAQGQVDTAHTWLVEAVLHAHELSVLHGYYQ